jgi:hypothetical protein
MKSERKRHIDIDPELRKRYAAAHFNKPLTASDEKLKRVLFAIFGREPKDLNDEDLIMIKMAIVEDSKNDMNLVADYLKGVKLAK